ncbi:Gfo/Idh/MocA family protein [Aquibacillus salsiterrae]|uniref:Gfo/Idh/MocA family oxidoreductase n=1 Tax=Aquibacillus salsiterrae TaxID=2950439 RepID=A0A9X3WDF2_9BACI|nr:Gfo/Idh/MocA family oxidoreductase [Aquibacillus salsiterrae]MDC3416055.1 Gfo/Idh/MocA family oxidoreductase [Aquibacillus salsiterrae]
MNKEVGIGMIGYQFMGKAHSHAYRDLPFYFDSKLTPVLKVISGRNESAVAEAAEKMGWQSYETDWRKVIERDDIEIVDIVTPNHTHAEIAIAAAEAGKHIITEKPLALTLDEAKRMYEAVKKNKVKHMICHNYRFAPAVQFAKKLIDDGKIGRIYHFRANYLQDWIMDPDFPLVWRLKKEVSGSGALGDIGAHSIDLARFLVGEFDELVGTMETFIKQRPISEMSGGLSAKADKSQMGEVTVDDAVAFIAKFENGALGTFEASRFAGGNRNKNKIEINGEKGSIRWDMENMNNLEVYLASDEPGLQGFRLINCTEEIHPYAGAYWPPGHIIGYEHTFIHLIHEFLSGIAENYQPKPNFDDGVKNQQVLVAIERSTESKQWVKVGEMK